MNLTNKAVVASGGTQPAVIAIQKVAMVCPESGDILQASDGRAVG
jgi:hypothetical protein